MICVVIDFFVKVLLEDFVVFSGNRIEILWVDTYLFVG